MSDSYGALVAVLLHGNGSNGSQAIIDSSLSQHVVTAVGNAQISTAQYKFGSSSIKFDGSGDRLSLPASALWNLSNNWTIEFWMYPVTLPSGTNTCRLIMIGTNGSTSALTVQFSYQGLVAVGVPAGGVTGVVTAVGAVATNAWHHYEISCTGGTGRIFIDGVLAGGPSTVTAQSSSSSDPLYVGYDTVGTVDYNFNGYLQDVRITRGLARHTANFTSPTGLLDDPDLTNLVRVLTPGLYSVARFGSGLARIAGTVDRLGVPGAYRVRLYHRQSGRLIASTRAAADGTYAFDGIDANPSAYTLVAIDDSDPLNAATADLITPVPPS